MAYGLAVPRRKPNLDPLMHPRDYRVAMFVVLGLMLVWGYCLLPESLGPVRRLYSSLIHKFNLHTDDPKISWWFEESFADSARSMLRTGFLSRQPAPQSIAGLTIRSGEWIIRPLDGLPDFTRDQRQIIVTSWAAMLDPESPWHAHVPELIAQGKSAPRPTLTYLIAHGILILLGSAVCICFWKSIPRANARQPLLPSPTDP